MKDDPYTYRDMRAVVAPNILSDPDGAVLHCPVCGEVYQHMGQVDDQLDRPEYAADWWGRGGVILLHMQGECGHIWQLCIGYHKGNSFIFARWNADDFTIAGGYHPENQLA